MDRYSLLCLVAAASATVVSASDANDLLTALAAITDDSQLDLADPFEGGQYQQQDYDDQLHDRSLYMAPYNQRSKIRGSSHHHHTPSVTCPYGGALQVPAVGHEVCIHPGEGICADGWSFFIDKYYDSNYLMLWNKADAKPVFKWFRGAKKLCVGEKYHNIAYMYVKYEEEACYLVGPWAGNPSKLPTLKIVPGSSHYSNKDVIVKHRDGAGDDDTLWELFANGKSSTSHDADWFCTSKAHPPSVPPAPTPNPTFPPTPVPTRHPSSLPSSSPSSSPSESPSLAPTSAPSLAPTVSIMPSTTPTSAPSSSPSESPSGSPSASPSESPSSSPSSEPSSMPSSAPLSAPSGASTTECDLNGVGKFEELVTRVSMATEPPFSDTERAVIIICPGTYTFTQDIEFNRRYFDMRCEDGGANGECIFDLAGFSFIAQGDQMTGGGGDEFSVIFQDLTFENGNADNRTPNLLPGFDRMFGRTGGAIFAFALNNSFLQTVGCRFSRNEAYGGGALSVFGNMNVIIDETTFFRNAALAEQESESSLQGCGGAILADDGFEGGQIMLSISGCTFDDNVALRVGGAVEFSPPMPGAMAVASSTFTKNKAMNLGGALAHFTAFVIIDKSTFTDNSSGFAGGAIVYGSEASGSINEALFSNNFNEINGLPLSPDIYRVEEMNETANIHCGIGFNNAFCDAVGEPTFVSTNFNNVTCAGSSTGPNASPECPRVTVNTRVGSNNNDAGYDASQWTWPRYISLRR